MKKYLVIIENTKTSFSASSPDIPGCAASGNTIEEAVSEMKDALELYLKDEEVLPEPKGLNHYMNDDSFKKNSSDYIIQVEIE